MRTLQALVVETELNAREIIGLNRGRRVAAANAITYHQVMNPLLMKIFGQVVRRAATDTVARRHIVGAAKKVVEEGREIGGSEDPAYAAGKAMRRTLDKLRRRDG